MNADQKKIYQNIKKTYNVEKQTSIYETLNDQKAAESYTPDHMLIEYNPFGSNTLSLYVYFTTDSPVSVSYTVHVNDKDISDFTRTAYQENTYQTEHEFQIIGLIPDITNTITFTLTSEDGVTSTYTTSYDMPSLYGEEKVKLDTQTLSTSEQLSDGLYAILGNDSSSMDFMYYYDNAGILRGEVPYSGYVSSVQDLSGHTLVDSGLKGVFTEYDENHQAIATYQMDIEKFIYRVYKYDFNGFYFSSAT